MFNLSNPQERAKFILQLQYDVDAYCREEFTEDARTHLGASIIGHDCAAYGWNVFRHLRAEEFSGQMYRLFNRGHQEEARFIKWLEGVGFQVLEFDPETKKQFRITGAKGHFGGSLDGMAKAPAKYGLGDLVLLTEYKTHNEKSFGKLAGGKTSKSGELKLRQGGEGVRKAKPQHFKQMCSYGRAYNFKYGLYCAVNKDTDELYFEIVELDYTLADDLFRKADSIVFSQNQPSKLAQVETYSECKYCNFAGICHRGEAPDKNCRSCKHAHAIEDAQWFCALYSNANGPIPKETIKTGCGSYERII